MITDLKKGVSQEKRLLISHAAWAKQHLSAGS